MERPAGVHRSSKSTWCSLYKEKCATNDSRNKNKVNLTTGNNKRQIERCTSSKQGTWRSRAVLDLDLDILEEVMSKWLEGVGR